MSKGKAKNAIAVVVTAVVIITTVIFAAGCFGIKPSESDAKNALAAPKNVAFDKDTYTLSWEKVEHASGYEISYNDSIIDVAAEQTTRRIWITAEQNAFKVKAVGDGVEYTDSAWSKEVKYTVETDPEQQTTFEKVNLALAKFAKEKGYELKKVIGISYVDAQEFIGNMNLRFETLCEKEGVLKNVRFCPAFVEEMSVVEMLENLGSASRVFFGENEIINYNSAQYMLDGKALDGEMSELKNQGYNLTVVDSFVTKGERRSDNRLVYDIVGTYKAERGNEIKYVTNITKVQISTPSTKEKENYEKALLISQMREVTETSFVLHEGTMAYMQELINRAANA